MKFIFSCLSLFLFANIAIAQTTMLVGEDVVIKSNFDLRFLISTHIDQNEKNSVANGYRIQVVNSSDREEVYTKKAEVYNYFSDFKGYIVYDQPYYKLRIGDFKTRLEARKFLDQIITIFPTAFIVADEVKVD